MIKHISTALLLASLYGDAFAQDISRQQAFDLLNRAMGPVGEESYAIYFEGITFKISKPLEIFSLPVYKVYRGGYLIVQGRKFEMQLGLMKGLCDGSLVVVTNEMTRTMIVDSLRDKMPEEFGQAPDLQQLIRENFGEADLVYEGRETVNGAVCHKVKAFYPDNKNVHVLYWISADKNELVLMADWDGSAYDVYWIRDIKKAPGSHNFSIHLPDRELEEYYGYEVFDFRFAVSDLKKTAIY